MQSTLVRPGARRYVSSAARTATGNSGAVDLPLADSYTFFLECSAASGTSPTLDVAIQVTPDGGTTWYTVLRFAQVTAAATRKIQVQGVQGRGEAGTEGAVADTGGALNANTILTGKIRILWTIGGTNPSFTFLLWCLSMPRTGLGQ